MSLTINEALKWLSFLMQKSFWWWQRSDIYIIREQVLWGKPAVLPAAAGKAGREVFVYSAVYCMRCVCVCVCEISPLPPPCPSPEQALWFPLWTWSTMFTYYVFTAGRHDSHCRFLLFDTWPQNSRPAKEPAESTWQGSNAYNIQHCTQTPLCQPCQRRQAKRLAFLTTPVP